MTILLKITWQGIAVGCGFFGTCLVLLYLFLVKGNQDPASKPQSNSTSILSMTPEDYGLLTERILKIEDKYKTIVFSTSKVEYLPVTIPCNIALSLAQRKRKCLLIDTDTRRNPIALAFELDLEIGKKTENPKAYKTSFDNLSIWPAQNLFHSNKVELPTFIAQTKDKFDFILINAPYLDKSYDQKQIVQSADCSFIFAKTVKEVTVLAELMNLSNCSVIGNILVHAS